MKCNLVRLVATTVAGAALGFGIAKVLECQDRMQHGSAAGQTLVDLSRALEIEKMRSGTYPESIGGLKVQSDFGDFSQAVLERVVYRKTTTGYIAFVGSPRVVFTEADTGVQFE